jgi:hypothetical protein
MNASKARLRISVALSATLAVTALGRCADTQADTPATAKPGMTYESLKDLPDFAGSWTPLTPPFLDFPASAPQTATLPPAERAQATVDATCNHLPQSVRPEVIATCRTTVRQRFLGGPADRGYCGKARFAGNPPAGAGGALEILFTPGRVTMAIESGLVRRIYMRDEPPPNALDESASGTSLGRWDGETLVVETTRLDSHAPFLPGSMLGEHAHVLERIRLVDANTLEIQSTLTAPAVLSAPITREQHYRRAPDRTFTDFDTCVEGDRSFDKASKQEQFDVTPPDDLPPPPSE